MVARLNGVQEAAGSNPVTRTKKIRTCESMSVFFLVLVQRRCAARRSASLKFLGGEAHPLPNPPHAGRTWMRKGTSGLLHFNMPRSGRIGRGAPRGRWRRTRAAGPSAACGVKSSHSDLVRRSLFRSASPASERAGKAPHPQASSSSQNRTRFAGLRFCVTGALRTCESMSVFFLVLVQRRCAAPGSASLKSLGGEAQPLPNPPHAGRTWMRKGISGLLTIQSWPLATGAKRPSAL